MATIRIYSITKTFTGNLTSIFRGEQVHRYALFGEVITEYNAYWHQGRIPDYKFNAKELDEENGMYYYSARYYNPPTFISRDPLFEKYPTISPYNYCLNNPLRFIDPTGMEVEHTTFKDKVITFFARMTNSTFREQYKILKNSKETYVFNHNNKGENSFGTDGNKLYINYSMNEGMKKDGHNLFSLMRHETEHGVQFEHGEFGFIFKEQKKSLSSFVEDFNVPDISTGKWVLRNHDIYDEKGAFDASIRGTINAGSNLDIYSKQTPEIKLKIMEKAYPANSTTLQNNTNTTKIKNDQMYFLPYKSRRK